MSDIKKENPKGKKLEEEDTEAGRMEKIRIRGSDPAAAFFLVLLCAALLAAIYLAYGFLQAPAETPVQTEGRKTVSVTGVSPGTEMPALPAENTLQAEPETEKPERETKEDPAELFFGPSLPSVVSVQLRVEGLTAAEKERTGFLESDFVRAASEFLDKNGIQAKQITLGEEICCSSDAIAYEAEISGWDDKVLSVLFYPDFPGRYLFILQDARTVTVPVQTQMPQTEKTQAVQNVPTQTEAPQSESSQTENAYDATRLSLTGMTRTLQNYLDNYYELQYRLYDYLYRNGYRDIKTVNVEDYEIDADTKTAVIYLKLPDGNIITGKYRKDENSYSFQ